MMAQCLVDSLRPRTLTVTHDYPAMTVAHTLTDCRGRRSQVMPVTSQRPPPPLPRRRRDGLTGSLHGGTGPQAPGPPGLGRRAPRRSETVLSTDSGSDGGTVTVPRAS
jgi:hypothetical protein